MPESFDSAMQLLVQDLDGMSMVLLPVMKAISDIHRDMHEGLEKFIENKGTVIEKSEKETKFSVNFEYYQEFRYMMRSDRHIMTASANVPRTFLVSLVSQFDAFMGRLVRAILTAQPEILNASGSTLSFAQLMQFGSLDDAREYIIEKEVEDMLRESHDEQFAWLERKLAMPLRKDLDAWPKFIEITERRNLFVHTGGIVSSQYINVCTKHRVQLNACKVGDQLYVRRKYFDQASDTLYELGVKLGQVIWRKLQPEELEDADEALGQVCYDLLIDERYELAKKLLAFATGTLRKHSSQEHKLIFIVNKAIAYKWGGEPDRARKVISDVDWSALSERFKLVSAVLLDDYDRAVQIMRRIGSTGEVTAMHYRTWPAFKDFRKHAEFLRAFEEIFGGKFEITESNTGEVSASDDQDDLRMHAIDPQGDLEEPRSTDIVGQP